MKVDLHMHSCHSDGVLTGIELVELARQRGVEQMSITDHDCISVYEEFSGKLPSDIKLVVGCEFSALWKKQTVHVVGLNLNLDSPVTNSAMRAQEEARDLRAEKIAEALARKGFPGALDGAINIAHGAILGRPHFAQLMVEQGFVKDSKQAFKKYLGAGKVGDINAQWPDLSEVCDWIFQSGGVPVLAHPAKYALTRTKLKELLADFKKVGGMAIEVISGKQDKSKTEQFAKLANSFDFYASLGSDFHRPGQPWADLGLIDSLPVNIKPVWQLWRE